MTRQNEPPAVHSGGRGDQHTGRGAVSSDFSIAERGLDVNTSADALARHTIRAILEGTGPPPDATPANCGAWAEHVAALIDAHARGGTEAARTAYNALAKDQPALIRLVAADAAPRKTTWTAAELLAATFPEPIWAVPDLIPVGLSFLAGRPKVGKSWLALQVAGAVGTGGMALDRRVTQGKVLFLALEDNPRRLQSRLEAQHIPATAAVTFKTTWRNFADGGLAELQDEIEAGHYSLVILDTLSRLLGRADQNDVAEMTVIVGNLQRVAQLHDLTILAIDHTRKATGLLSSPIDDILGSTAKAAVADAALVLVCEQGRHGATLKVTGRDLDEQELAIEWDATTCCWQVLGEAGQVRKDTAEAEILAAIADLTEMGETSTTTRIAAYLGKNKGNVSRQLAELVRGGHVLKGARVGREQPYRLP